MEPDQGEVRLVKREQNGLIDFIRDDFQCFIHICYLEVINIFDMSEKSFRVEELQEGKIVRLTLSRPKSKNAISWNTMLEFGQLFRNINTHPTVRVVIVEGDGSLFTSGLDLKEASQLFGRGSGDDVARDAIEMDGVIQKFQECFLAIHECRVPVVMAAHNYCLGAGVDFLSAADIRFCTKDWYKFAIREIDLGIATDIGTLQFFPKFTGSSSTFKELVLTGRLFGAQQAHRIGYVSKVFENKQEMQKGLLELAKELASKSPVGINALKSTINNGEKDLYEGFRYVKKMNSVMFKTGDLMEAFTSYLQKRTPVFPKL